MDSSVKPDEGNVSTPREACGHLTPSSSEQVLFVDEAETGIQMNPVEAAAAD